MEEESKSENGRLPVWEDPDIDLERARANGEKWKQHDGATRENMMSEYKKAKKIFEE